MKGIHSTQCKAHLKKKDVRVCAACRQMVYCSKMCQLVHWKEIHSSECKDYAEGRRGPPREHFLLPLRDR